jgi:hypothetical protein
MKHNFDFYKYLPSRPNLCKTLRRAGCFQLWRIAFAFILRFYIYCFQIPSVLAVPAEALCESWRQIIDSFRTWEIEYGFSAEEIQIVFKALRLTI